MATCTHENPHYAVNARLVCFACFMAHRAEARTALVTELTRLLASGVTLLETWPSDQAMTDWSIDTFTGDWRIFYHSSCTESKKPHRGARTIEAVAPRAEALARHLENRHYHFGTTLAAYCLTCGEESATLLAEHNDPTCPGCAVTLAAFAAMDEAARAEDRAEGY